VTLLSQPSISATGIIAIQRIVSHPFSRRMKTADDGRDESSVFMAVVFPRYG
jgi:hypothetical protein